MTILRQIIFSAHFFVKFQGEKNFVFLLTALTNCTVVCLSTMCIV